MTIAEKNSASLTRLKLYIPRMSYSGARVMAAAFHSIGIEAEPSPASDALTLELGAKYISGDECLPQRVTLGNFLKIIEDEFFDPEHTAFLLPTAGGPCRFGQYQPLMKKILRDKGLPQVKVLSPTSNNGYEGFGDQSKNLIRTAWHAVVASDILRKIHLKYRPYELEKGMANEVFHQSLDDVCQAVAEPNLPTKKKLKNIRDALIRALQRYHKIPVRFTETKLLIGIIGEIYCRLDEFSNNYLVNKIEEYGGEVWISDVAEWLWYTNDEQRWRLIRAGKRHSKDMLLAKIKFHVQHADEQYLMKPFQKEFLGYEEPKSILQILNFSRPYLPREGALGEMVINMGKTIYLYHKGADGVIDVSPFSCMNGIVCEAIYPQLSKDYNNFPVRTFYFDGTQNDITRDLGIFMELVRNYQKRKTVPRKFSFINETYTKTVTKKDLVIE